MKTLLKTVSITLIASVTVLFFSSYRKVEAAAAGAAVAAGTAIAAIGSLIVSAAAYFADTFPNVDVAGIISHTEFKESISVSEDGTATYTRPSSPYVQVNEKAWAAFNALAEESTKEYNSSLRVYVCGSGGGDPGNNGKIPLDAFNAALKGTILGALACGTVEWLGDVTGGTSSGAVSGITSGISVINGKPQKVTTTYAESTVEVFDYLGLDYQMFNSLEDVFVDCSVTRTYKYYRPFIITTDNKLYTFENEIQFSYKIGSYSSAYLQFYGVRDRFAVSTNGENDTYRAFRFYIKDGILCVAFYLSQVDTSNRLTRKQFIVSNPSLSNYPVLFSDKLSYKTIGSTNFENYAANFNLYCVPDKTSIEANEIMSLDIACVGCFKGKPQAPTPDINSSTLQTASNMLAGTESIVQGGTNTTYSELSDIEKAIYALAKQQGITYEEMLEQSNLVVENGQIYLEGLDGVTHSIESLLSEFDKLLEQGDITNENIAASTEQLKAILEYLKGLNIEGLGSYIQQLETTLDGLKQGDKDREAILGDISGQLTDLKDYLDSLGLAGIGADIKNISQILSDSAALELDVTEIESIDPDWYIEKFPFCLPFDFYRILTLFVRDPVPPVFTVPIEAEFTSFGLNQSVDEEIVLDLTVFKVNGVDIVQVVLNFVCILGFVLMLIHTTTKFFV